MLCSPGLHKKVIVKYYYNFIIYYLIICRSFEFQPFPSKAQLSTNREPSFAWKLTASTVTTLIVL